MSPPLRSIVVALAAATAALLPASAEAQDCDVGPGDLGLAFIWPERDCRHNLHVDLRWSLYKSSATPWWQTQLTGEVGLLERIDDTIVQIGPVLAFGGAGQTHDWEGEFDERVLSPRVRARMWMVDEWLTFEAAAGPSFAWTQGPRGDWQGRAGAYVEVGPTFHGAAGFFVGTGYLPAAHDAPGEWRTTIGLRMNLAFSAAVAAGAGLTYACAQSTGGC